VRRRSLLGVVVASVGGAIAWACGARSESSPTAPPAITVPASAPPTPTATPPPTASPTPTALKDAQGRFVLIETHSHLQVQSAGGGSDFDGAIAKIGPELDQNAGRLAILMSQPFPTGTLDVSSVERGIYDRAKTSRYVPLGGGGSLNAIIQQNAKNATVSADVMKGFEALAEKHIALGAVGFGEIAVLHLSFSPQHPFEEVAADHPLWLLLAAVAARRDVPIDVHMDAMVEDGPTPPRNRQVSPLNPPTLKANVPGFERLLDHDRRARIVWAHTGSDRTGQVTIALYDRLMAAHPNLHLQLIHNVNDPPQFAQDPNNLVDARGQIRQGYVDLIRRYPDRIVVGGDSFFAAPGAGSAIPGAGPNVSGLRAIVDKLPADVASKIAIENALRIYKIKL